MTRTQQERREATIGRLLDASIATISDIGYARASVKVIAARAGLSYGALFRHFPTMGDFMAATARETLRRQLQTFTERFRELATQDSDLEAALRVVREVAGNATNTVLYELMIAARTDEQLRDALQPALVEYGMKIVEISAETVGKNRSFDDEEFITLVFMVTDLFDGEAILRSVRPFPQLESRRIPLLLNMIAATGMTRTAELPPAE
ncbi:TetR/AcrR family transcriptional regulator [Nocardia sp. NPDC004722]